MTGFDFNIIILFGFLLRVFKYFKDTYFPFNMVSEDGKKNVKKVIFSGIISLFIYWLSFYYHPAPEQMEGLDFIALLLVYFIIGWGADSLLLWLIETVIEGGKDTILKYFKIDRNKSPDINRMDGGQS